MRKGARLPAAVGVDDVDGQVGVLRDRAHVHAVDREVVGAWGGQLPDGRVVPRREEGLGVELQRELRREDEVHAERDRPLGLVEAAEDVAAPKVEVAVASGTVARYWATMWARQKRGRRGEGERRPGPEVEGGRVRPAAAAELAVRELRRGARPRSAGGRRSWPRGSGSRCRAGSWSARRASACRPRCSRTCRGSGRAASSSGTAPPAVTADAVALALAPVVERPPLRDGELPGCGSTRPASASGRGPGRGRRPGRSGWRSRGRSARSRG